MDKKVDKDKKENKRKKIILFIILLLTILVIVISLLLKVRSDKLKGSLGIIPFVSYKASTYNLVQDYNTEINFEGKFNTYGGNSYFYKWMVYKNGTKAEESTCERMQNNFVDKRTIKLDSDLNFGKWAIYSDDSCERQVMVYFTLTYSVINKDLFLKTRTALFDKNNALAISDVKKECTTVGYSCFVTAPTITAPSGYEVVGWNTDKNATEAIYKPGSRILAGDNITYYAIVKKSSSPSNSSKTLVASFNKNKASSIGRQSASCTTTTGSCYVTLPSIIAPNGYEVAGWDTNKNAIVARYSVGDYVKISSNETFYAIIKKTNSNSSKTLTVTFNKNKASSISKQNASCTTVSGSCYITLPSITAPYGYEVIGWDSNPNAITASYKSGSRISVSSNMTLYAIVKQKASISMNRFTEVWDTAGQFGRLKIKVTPLTDTYTVKSSNENVMVVFKDILYAIGPGTATITATSSSGASVSYTYRVTSRKLINDESRLKKGIASSYKVGDTMVYVEKGCPTNLANRTKNDILDVPSNILKSTRTIYLLTRSTYKTLNSKYASSVGLAHSSGYINYIDVDCEFDGIDVITHEIGHTFDHYSTLLTGKAKFSARQEFVQMFNKYEDKKGFLRISHYGSPLEMFADTFAYYHRTYFAKKNSPVSSGYYKLKYPNDIESVMRNYIQEYNSLN